MLWRSVADVRVECEIKTATANLHVSVDLGVGEVLEDLWELGQVDVDELRLQIQAEQREEVTLLHYNQLVVSLKVTST